MALSQVKLGDCLTILTDYHANGSYEKLRENVMLLDVPNYAVMIRTTNFEKDDLVEDLKYINEHAYHYLAKSKVYPGDILMNKIANPGSVYLMPNLRRPVSLAMNLFLLRTDETRLNQMYAYYWLKANEAYVKGFACGAAAATITKKAVRELEIQLPDISVQKKISIILFSYEELIQKNQRRIRILEKMAQLIYREWFINFRFPGHEKVRMVDSTLGKIPDGWAVKKVSEVSDVIKGKGYKGSELSESEGVPFVNLKCINRDGGFRNNGLKRFTGKFNDQHKVRFGSIVMAVTDMTQERRIVARAARVPSLNGAEGVVSMDLVKIQPLQEIAADYLYGMFRFSQFADHIKQYATGVNVLHLNPEHIENYKFPLAPTLLQNRYAWIAKPIYDVCDVLSQMNDNLKITRDLLLHKLISGELDVSAIDIEIPAKTK